MYLSTRNPFDWFDGYALTLVFLRDNISTCQYFLSVIEVWCFDAFLSTNAAKGTIISTPFWQGQKHWLEREILGTSVWNFIFNHRKILCYNVNLFVRNEWTPASITADISFPRSVGIRHMFGIFSSVSLNSSQVRPFFMSNFSKVRCFPNEFKFNKGPVFPHT